MPPIPLDLVKPTGQPIPELLEKLAMPIGDPIPALREAPATFPSTLRGLEDLKRKHLPETKVAKCWY
jgi:hypothetical protein